MSDEQEGGIGKNGTGIKDSNVGVVGDHAKIDGGVHFHYHSDRDAGASGDPERTSPKARKPEKIQDAPGQAEAVKNERPKPSMEKTAFDPETTADILHLSDLHFGADADSDPIADANRWYGQLIDDLHDELDCHRLHAVVISGDIGSFSLPEEYRAAEVFLERLRNKFGLDASRLVIAPGNHDLNWKISKKGYHLIDEENHDKPLKEGQFIRVSEDVIRLRDDSAYALRFRNFSKFHQNATGRPYPLEPKEQGTLHHLPELNLLICGFNSAWEADHHFRSRDSIHPDAVALALDRIRERPDLKKCLKFAVWHHPLSSPHEDHIKDHGFMERLAQSGFHACLHGHIHKADAGLFRYDMSADGRRIHVIGAGAFGAPVREWTSGYPLQYNLLRLSGNTLRVVTRRRIEPNGAWEPDHMWRQGKGQPNLPYYDIPIGEKPDPKLHKTSSHAPTVQNPADPALQKAIENYRRKAEALHAKLPLMGFYTKLRVPIRIEDIYIPLRAMIDRRPTGKACFADAEDAEDCLREHGGEEISVPEAFLKSERMGRRGVVILGDPGSGKTTHMKRVLLWCLSNGLERLGLPAGMIPVFLPLRELRNLKDGLDAFIQEQLDLPHLDTPEGFGRVLLERGNLLFLFDGLDEVSDSTERIAVSQWIDDALRIHESCRFMVTCRFAGYTPEARMSEEFLEMHMRPLSTGQAEAFIRNWYRIVESGFSEDSHQAGLIAGERADNLIERLRQPDFRSMRIFTMTRNPLLLTNLCLVHRDRGRLPRRRARLYEESLDVLLELWREAIGFKSKVDARTGRRVLQPAAWWLHQEEGRTRASAAELAPVIDPALASVGWPHGSAADFLRIVRDESGLLTGWDQENYGFMHLGFQEYLAAREIQNLAYHDPDVLKQLARRFGESWWQEVILLMLARENPCVFGSFMAEVVKQPAFVAHSDFVDMCLEETAEISLQPFLDIVKAEAGKDSDFWQRQLAALRIIERLDKKAIDDLAGTLGNHPDVRIRKWVRERVIAAFQDVIRPAPSGYEMVFIPGGTFMMGSPETEKGRDEDEGPLHEVTVPDFYMGRYPVANEEYKRFLEENPKMEEPEYWADRRYNQPRQPVIGVSWHDAQNFARWAGLHLPSEAQWEYACRAGTTTRYYTGDLEADLDLAGWYDKNSGGKLHPVGAKEPNDFGLYDMHGNVFECCEDHWHGYYKGSPSDGSSWVNRDEGAFRVMRGGAWSIVAEYCRTACRIGLAPGLRIHFVGFRLVRLPGQLGEPDKSSE